MQAPTRISGFTSTSFSNGMLGVPAATAGNALNSEGCSTSSCGPYEHVPVHPSSTPSLPESSLSMESIQEMQGTFGLNSRSSRLATVDRIMLPEQYDILRQQNIDESSTSYVSGVNPERMSPFLHGSTSSSPAGSDILPLHYANNSMGSHPSDMDIASMRDRHGAYHYPGPSNSSSMSSSNFRGDRESHGQKAQATAPHVQTSHDAVDDVPVVELNSFSTWYYYYFYACVNADHFVQTYSCSMGVCNEHSFPGSSSADADVNVNHSSCSNLDSSTSRSPSIVPDSNRTQYQRKGNDSVTMRDPWPEDSTSSCPYDAFHLPSITRCASKYLTTV